MFSVEQMQMKVLRQTPEERKVISHVLKIASARLDDFAKGRVTLTGEELQGVDDWLSGNYVMRSSTGGHVLAPLRRPEGGRLMTPPPVAAGKRYEIGQTAQPPKLVSDQPKAKPKPKAPEKAKTQPMMAAWLKRT